MNLLLISKHYLIALMLAMKFKPKLRNNSLAQNYAGNKDWDISLLSSKVFEIFRNFQIRSGPLHSNHEKIIVINDFLLPDFLINLFKLERNSLFNIRIKIYGDSKIYKKFDKNVSPLFFVQITNALSSKSRFYIEIKAVSSSQEKLIVANEIYTFRGSGQNIQMKETSNTLVSSCTLSEFDEFYPIVEYSTSNSFLGTNNGQGVDAVITWVNSQDPEWQQLWSSKFNCDSLSSSQNANIYQDPDRFSSGLELLFCIRSIYAYMSWVRNIYIVSNCHPPDWINHEDSRISWIDHSSILSDEYLPTFNSHAIESSLHKIPGLSEQFIYFNDDFVVTKPTSKGFFFDSIGRPIFHHEDYSYIYKSLKLDAQSSKQFLLASKNSMMMLLEANLTLPPSLNLHTHTPYAHSKSNLNSLERQFPHHFHRTRLAALRSNTDINIMSFTAYWYGYSLGTYVSKALKNNIDYKIVRPTNLSQVLKSKKPRFYCFNDGSGSSLQATYKSKVNEYCFELFPYTSPAEKTISIKDDLL